MGETRTQAGGAPRGENLGHFQKAALKSLPAPCSHLVGSEAEMRAGGTAPGPRQGWDQPGSAAGRAPISPGYSLTPHGGSRTAARTAPPLPAPGWNLAPRLPSASVRDGTALPARPAFPEPAGEADEPIHGGDVPCPSARLLQPSGRACCSNAVSALAEISRAFSSL